MDTVSDSDDSTDSQYLENAGPFARIFNRQFTSLMALISYLSIKQSRHPLAAPLLCIRFFLDEGVEPQGEGFPGPTDKGDVVGLLEMLAAYDDNINDDVIKKVPLIERDLIRLCSEVTTKSIVKDIGGDYYAILVDKYCDFRHNHPIALCVRYVDKTGDVVERFLGIMNVMDDDTDVSIKKTVDALLEKHSLSSFNISARSAKKTIRGQLFFYLEDLVNVVLVSWKENDMLKESKFQKVTQAFDDLKIEHGKCFHQETTCWEPYKLVMIFIEYYPVILNIIDEVANESPFSVRHRDRIGTSFLLWGDTRDTIENFDSVFSAHLMKTVFEVTNELSIVLQKKDENIVAAMSLVKLVKERLQIIRDEGWETLLSSVVLFCNKNDIKVPIMEHIYPSIKK
ncbi:uncharacterized protein LOC143544490 [Bidens hawaiensis]|uniref:uncharacterized protein LOC143544490 n=1 Tax=Bidens hawaiensis TaxID=980011 RepID=UPI00404B3A62